MRGRAKDASSADLVTLARMAFVRKPSTSTMPRQRLSGQS